ncbi:non-specific serine/threonine protein kinase [Anaeramoeba flamelloides]|uniref:Non-specific serine/threonine protein kinase n=1 Tax=Anaeramoeba flamelloides TaxID=1746091 RepID=A0ABQ8XYN3_9EUKA|nr:non-specific serine/threonine protein kinase [Anaeramoeba flamelloides]
MRRRRRKTTPLQTERNINSDNKIKNKKKEVKPMYWPARRKSFRKLKYKKKNIPTHQGGNVDFKVIKISSYGKRQKRKLRCSRSGVSNLSGKGTKWFLKSDDVYSITKSPNSSNKFIITVLHRFNFEVEEEDQVERIIDTFRSLNLGKFPKNQRKRSKTIPRSLETTFSFVNDFKITPNSFEYLSLIGQGSYGKVYQVKNKKTQKVYAMKVLNKGDIYRRKQVDHTRTEQLILSTISHPFIVTLHYSFQTEKQLYIVLDYVKGGELFFHLRRAGRGRFPEYLAMFYLAEIILAIEYLHKIHIVYRDLKPENVLLNEDGHIKLTDFGLAKTGVSFGGSNKKKIKKNNSKNGNGKEEGGEKGKVGTMGNNNKEEEGEEKKAQTFCGTPAYFAPEVLLKNAYGKTVDYWTIGVFLFEMLTGRPPFIAENRNEMFRAIIQDQPVYPNYLSEEAIDIISRFLQKNPDKRLGSQGFSEIKKHKFFKKIDWKKLNNKKIVPPFKPIVKNDPNDTSCFDSNLTSRNIVVDESEIPQTTFSLLGKNEFPGFYYERIVTQTSNFNTNDLETLYLEQSSDDLSGSDDENVFVNDEEK